MKSNGQKLQLLQKIGYSGQMLLTKRVLLPASANLTRFRAGVTLCLALDSAPAQVEKHYQCQI